MPWIGLERNGPGLIGGVWALTVCVDCLGACDWAIGLVGWYWLVRGVKALEWAVMSYGAIWGVWEMKKPPEGAWAVALSL